MRQVWTICRANDWHRIRGTKALEQECRSPRYRWRRLTADVQPGLAIQGKARCCASGIRKTTFLRSILGCNTRRQYPRIKYGHDLAFVQEMGQP
jgi:hypothetical protein